MKRRTKRRSASRAFTLLEVLLVLVILVVLGSMASVAVLGSQDRALKNAAKSQVQTFERAIDLYQFNMKKLPESLEDLINKPSDAKLAERWGTKPYLTKKAIPLDPWDNEYRFEASGDGYRVWSTGPDGNDGTDDDVSTDG